MLFWAPQVELQSAFSALLYIHDSYFPSFLIKNSIMTKFDIPLSGRYPISCGAHP